jgi:hypothetical protein
MIKTIETKYFFIIYPKAYNAFYTAFYRLLDTLPPSFTLKESMHASTYRHETNRKYG